MMYAAMVLVSASPIRANVAKCPCTATTPCPIPSCQRCMVTTNCN